VSRFGMGNNSLGPQRTGLTLRKNTRWVGLNTYEWRSKETELQREEEEEEQGEERKRGKMRNKRNGDDAPCLGSGFSKKEKLTFHLFVLKKFQEREKQKKNEREKRERVGNDKS